MFQYTEDVHSINSLISSFNTLLSKSNPLVKTGERFFEHNDESVIIIDGKSFREYAKSAVNKGTG